MENLISVYEQAKQWELDEGRAYYRKQKERLRRRAEAENLPLDKVVAAFCALSPNNAESTNYRALDTCLGIHANRLPAYNKVIAYPMNKQKALSILRGANIDETLRGRKVYSFYQNTMDDTNVKFITVDGHMLSAWAGRRFILRREAEIKSKEYEEIKEDFLASAICKNQLPSHFQATIWLTWKRLNRILYQPQLQLPFLDDPFASHLGSPSEAGVLVRRDMSSIPAMESGMA